MPIQGQYKVFCKTKQYRQTKKNNRKNCRRLARMCIANYIKMLSDNVSPFTVADVLTSKNNSIFCS